MINDSFDLQITGKETQEQLDALFQEKLGLGLSEMKQTLSTYTQQKAASLAEDFVNIAPHGDYSKLLEDCQGRTNFLKEEAHKPEYWRAYFVQIEGGKDASMHSMIEVGFRNSAVDDGEVLQGFVFVSFTGKILHAFVRSDE